MSEIVNNLLKICEIYEKAKFKELSGVNIPEVIDELEREVAELGLEKIYGVDIGKVYTTFKKEVKLPITFVGFGGEVIGRVNVELDVPIRLSKCLSRLYRMLARYDKVLSSVKDVLTTLVEAKLVSEDKVKPVLDKLNEDIEKCKKLLKVTSRIMYSEEAIARDIFSIYRRVKRGFLPNGEILKKLEKYFKEIIEN